MAPTMQKSHHSKHGARKQPDDEELTNMRRRMHWTTATLRPLAEQVFAPEFAAITSSARGYVFLDEENEEAEASWRLQKELARRRVETFGAAEREYEDTQQPDEPRAFLEWQCLTLEGFIQQDLQRGPAFAAPSLAAGQQPQAYHLPPFMMPATSAGAMQHPYLNVSPANSISTNIAPHNNVQGLQQHVRAPPGGVGGRQLLPLPQAPQYSLMPFLTLQLPSGTFIWHECCQGYFFAQYDHTGIPLIYLIKAWLDGVRGCWVEANEIEIARRGMPHDSVRSFTFFPDGTGPEVQRASMFDRPFYPRHPRQLLDMPDSRHTRPKKKKRARTADDVHPEGLPTKKVRFAEGTGNAKDKEIVIVDPRKIRIQRISESHPEQADGPEVDGEVFEDSPWRFWKRSHLRATVKKTGKAFELGGVPHSAFLADDLTVRADVEKKAYKETGT